MSESKTPLLDDLEKGQWPSFVTEIKKMAETKPMAQDLLSLLELSYKDKRGYWKHGGLVGIMGYGGGVIGRYTEKPEEFPGVREFHTMRLNQPSGWFYTTKALRTVCDIWEVKGSGLTNMHGATGDIILLGTTTDQLQPLFNAYSNEGFDLGGSGSNLRTPSCCCGMARCEYACIDTMDLCHNLTNHYQDELHRPMWPYKSKIKISGCPNDCVGAIARSDFAILGTWRDDLRIDQAAVREYVEKGLDIQEIVIDRCPTSALNWDGNELQFKSEECVRCMHCINTMSKAIRTGVDKGATILVGGKAPILQSAFLGWVIVPFMKMEKENDYQEFKDFVEKAWEWWDEEAKVRERIGETICRLGMRNFLRAVELEPIPQMIFKPRTNPYVFWWPEDLN
ncbi:MAG: dissimilatory-type sulfite reductase subunit alpha [Desulfotomaculum sp.]|nr:dissimilatory-type sulfite reductase subunit alpha [Desulfotomaculum sp.]